MPMKRPPTGTHGGRMHNTYELVCGMEVHAELATKSKMFCSCKNDPFHAAKPNIHTCPVCLGMPGALPVANKTAIEWTIKLGLALGCKINLFSKFDRKHYFYPDLPKGYQISQYDLPFCYDGVLQTTTGAVRIRRIHLEEDTGKLLHKTIDDTKVSLIDFNRSSVPLIEIVTEPDIKSAAQAKEYAKKLRQIIRHLHIAECDMEQGGMRLEANISLRPVGETKYPAYKVELKNINSFRFLEQGIAYEIARQTQLLQDNQIIPQETRGFNSTKGETFVQRTKEDAADYRYFPDPDIPPLTFTTAQIESWRAELPELPGAVVTRWQTEYLVEPRFAEPLIAEPEHVSVLEKLFLTARAQKIDCGKLAGALHNKRIPFPTLKTLAQTLTAFTDAGRTDVVDTSTLEQAVNEVLTENPDVVEKFKAGQQQVLGFIIGQTMRKLSGSKPDQELLRDTIGKALKAR